MKNFLKYTAWIIGGTILLVLLVVAYLIATFDPNDYKQQVIDAVKKGKNRTLSIDGDITLSFWPKLGADLGKVAISEFGSDTTFASIDSAKVALEVIPLLKQSLVVDTVYKDGSTNFDDLLSQDEASENANIQFNVQGVEVSNSAFSYTDEAQDAEYNISEFGLVSGHIALAEPINLETNFKVNAKQPALAIQKHIKGTFLYDPEKQHFQVSGLDSLVTGEMFGGKNMEVKTTGDVDVELDHLTVAVNGLKLVATGDFDGVKQAVNLSAPAINIKDDKVNSQQVTVNFTQNKAADQLSLNMVLANMSGSTKAIQSTGITGDLSMTQGKHTVTSKFSSPFKGNIDALIFDIPKLAGQLNIKDPSLPNGAMQGTFNLSANADLNKAVANSQFNLVFADTKLNGNATVANFKESPSIKFNVTSPKLDLDQLLGAPSQSAPSKSNNQPADLSALSTLLLDGKLNIGKIVYHKHTVSNLNLGLKADGKKVAVNGLNVKVDKSQIKGALSVSQFKNPLYSFDLDIDQVNLNDYVTEGESNTKTTGDEKIDLSALKTLNANGALRIKKLNYGETKLANVRVKLTADGGVAMLSPFSANLYSGKMAGSLKVDARSTPSITFKQKLSSVSVGPLLHDTINNDMLSGRGTVNIDVNTSGNSVNAFKKALSGSSSLALTDGALKGIDIAGQIRGIKNKFNSIKGNAVEQTSDASKKTDFSELTASFGIKNGVATNNDLAMKAPILRLAKGKSGGTINIGQESINYTAIPTIVKSIKGQGGEDLNQLAGISVPLKISGSFANPKFGLDAKALIKGAAKAKLLEKVGGKKGAAVQELLEGDNKVDALKTLLEKKKKDPNALPEEKPKSIEDQAKEGLKDLLKF